MQPALLQDFDALYDEFVLEMGHGRLRPFVEHLAAFDLLPGPLVIELLADVPDAPPGAAAKRSSSPAPPPPAKERPALEPLAPLPSPAAADPHADTVKLPARETLLAAEAAAERHKAEWDAKRKAQQAAAVAPTVETTTKGLDSQLGAFGGDDDEWEDVPVPEEGARRTMFRKVSGGELKETGRFGEEEEARPRRRRRRRMPSVDGHYAFRGTVGEGAMGRVLLAVDQQLHRPVAYKAMADDLREQPTLASKFTAEAQITAQLDHPSIVPVYTLESDTAYTMKLIEGQTLEDVISEVRGLEKRGAPLPERIDIQGRLEMFLRVCEAVSYAHSRGVIHRDLKPENIMVGQWGEVFVMDWGIAKVFATDVEQPVEIGTAPDDEGDLIIGTAGYMSPEQAEGLNEALDAASDQYALGLILFELVSLRPAVTGKVPLKMVMRHQDGEKDPLVHIAGRRLPKELVAIVHKATARAKNRRYASVSDLADDIRRFQRGEPVVARPDGPIGALLRWVGRHRELTLFVVVAVFLGSFLLIGVVGAWGQIRLAQAQAREQALSTTLTAAARQASELDGQFLKYEGLLSVVGTAASEALIRPAGEGDRLYFAADYADRATAPPDADVPRDAEKYGKRLVSTVEPVFVAAAPDDEEVLRLGDIGRHLQRVLLRSHSEKRAAGINQAMARRTIVDVDIPVSWAFVALDSGAMVSFPGHGDWPDDFEATRTSWYRDGDDQQAPVWGRVTSHPVAGRSVLTVSQAVYDKTDHPLGVAGLHVALAPLLDLMIPEELSRGEGIEAALLDDAGTVVVRSGLADDPTLPLGQPFGIDAIDEAIEVHRNGFVTSDGELYLFNRLTSNGWTYVLHGPVDSMRP